VPVLLHNQDTLSQSHLILQVLLFPSSFFDYDKNSQMTREFYATVQNKMHYAVHGNTAAEVIVERD